MFSSDIEGLNDSPSNGGFDPSALIQGFSGGSQAGGFSMSNSGSISGNELATATGALAGGIAGSAFGIPPDIGGKIGAAIGGLFGGRGPQPANGIFQGLHSPTLEPLDDSQWWEGDAKLMAYWARKNGISVEEVAILMAYDMAVSGNPPQYVWDAYAAGGEDGGGANSIAERLRQYNNANMGARIVSGQFGPSNLTSSVFPAIVDWKGGAKQIMLRAKSVTSTPTTTPIQTMSAAPAPTASASLGQIEQLAYRGVPQANSFLGQYSAPPLATPGFVPPVSQPTSPTPAPAPKSDNTTTYALIGGGVALLLLVAVLLFKK